MSARTNEVLASLVEAAIRTEERAVRTEASAATILRWTKASTAAAMVAAVLAFVAIIVGVVLR